MSNQWYDIELWQWVDLDINQWGFSTSTGLSGLYQICTDDNCVYAATSSGLDIVSLETEERINFIEPAGYTFTTVWASEYVIFLGTSISGIKAINKVDIYNSDLLSYVYDYVVYPDILSNTVAYLHGNSDKLICCTAGSVDIIRRSTHYITHTEIVGAKKCFVTPVLNYFYYTVLSAGKYKLHRLNSNTTDWTTSDVV